MEEDFKLDYTLDTNVSTVVPKLKKNLVAILENITVTEAHQMTRLYTEQCLNLLLLSEISSQVGISCSHWLIWLLCGEPL